MLYIYFLERKAHCSPSNRFSKHKTFLNIFWSCYSAYLDLENTIATPYPYHILKNCPMVLIYYSFSLIQLFSHKINPHRWSLSQKTRTMSFNRSSLNHLWRRMELWKHWLNLEYQYPKFWFNMVFVIFEFISLLYELMILWFWMIFYCSSPLFGFRFLVFGSFLSLSLSVFHSVSWSFLYFFYLINLIRFDKLIWFL